MGEFTDCNECSICGKEIADKARVVVEQVTGGNLDVSEGTVGYDLYDYEKKISHEECYMKGG